MGPLIRSIGELLSVGHLLLCVVFLMSFFVMSAD